MPFTVYHKNALRLAELGLGDGTIYASGSGATPNTGQKTFVVTGLTFAPYIGANVDDKFNGHLLYFPASGNRYHIVDWVASTNTATVYKNPASTDTGACEIRRALVCNKQLAGNPAHRLADGQRFSLWNAASNNAIDVHLPNLIKNGGFESGSVSPWEKNFDGGSADGSGVNSVTPILGTYDVSLDIGNRTNVLYKNEIVEPMYKGRTYRLVFKGRKTGGSFVADKFYFQFYYQTANVAFTFTWTPITAGSSNAASWFPTLGTSNAWHVVDLVPDRDLPAGSKLAMVITTGATFGVSLDEIYLWEKVDVRSLLIWDGLPSWAFNFLYGSFCAMDRTSASVGADSFIIINGGYQSGKDFVSVDFGSNPYPVFSIQFNDLTQASEILLGEKWEWKFPPELPDDPEREEYNESRFKSRSGVVDRILHSKQRVPGMELKLIDPVDVAVWQGDFKAHHLDPCHPFAAKWDGNWGDRVILFRSTEPGFSLPRRTPNYPDKKLEWEEVL